ncbi:MAG: GNAT family N-acetyltransferase [Ruminococcaceae bacterium]|nr:GNAT family N-acetyltransferase [Oscillospiraceae bacterium]
MEFKILNDLNDDIINLRTKTFVIGRAVPKEVDFDGKDKGLMHFCLYDSGKLLAYLRAEKIENYLHIGRVCVDESVRKKGYGKKLLNYLFEYSKENEFSMIELSAVDSAVGFYERIGFSKKGEFYMEAGAPHIYMSKNIE